MAPGPPWRPWDVADRGGQCETGTRAGRMASWTRAVASARATALPTTTTERPRHAGDSGCRGRLLRGAAAPRAGTAWRVGRRTTSKGTCSSRACTTSRPTATCRPPRTRHRPPDALPGRRRPGLTGPARASLKGELEVGRSEPPGTADFLVLPRPGAGRLPRSGAGWGRRRREDRLHLERGDLRVLRPDQRRVPGNVGCREAVA